MDRRTMLMMGGTAAMASVVGLERTAGAAEMAGSEISCGDCRTACLRCVISCLEESDREECIRLCLDCADICTACDAIAARKGPMMAALMKVCAEACDQCADECEKHKDDAACQACAEACRKCAEECREMMKSR